MSFRRWVPASNDENVTGARSTASDERWKVASALQRCLAAAPAGAQRGDAIPLGVRNVSPFRVSSPGFCIWRFGYSGNQGEICVVSVSPSDDCRRTTARRSLDEMIAHGRSEAGNHWLSGGQLPARWAVAQGGFSTASPSGTVGVRHGPAETAGLQTH
jgi:hypothetical protein